MNIAEKSFSGLLVTFAAYITGEFNMLTLVMTLLILSDFGTGSLRVLINKEAYDSDLAFRGLIKKFLYLFVWFLAVMMQLVLKELAPIVGMEMNKPILAFIVTAWIIGTELNSIINNLNKAGVKVPLSLSKVSKQLTDMDKEKVE